MEWRTRFERNRVFTEPGSPVIDVYGYVEDKETGEKVLKVVGKKNQYEEIQSFKNECDINYLLARFTNGDLGALNQREAFYADVTDLQQDYRDILNAAHAVENAFNSLPDDIKSNYNNAEEWLASLQTQTAEPAEPPVPAAPSTVESGKEENIAEN